MQLRRRLVCLLVPFLLAVPLAARADNGVIVMQKNRMFDRSTVSVHPGDTVRFLNRDDFDHQIYVASPGFSFESDEMQPGHEVDVRFPRAGVFQVRCHIHPRMAMTVVVR